MSSPGSEAAPAAELKLWDYPDPGRTERVGVFLASTVAGVAFGVASDWWWPLDGFVPTLAEAFAGLLFAPITVTLGGAWTVTGSGAVLLGLGGLAFWPVYCLLAWLALMKRVPLIWAGTLLWCAQAFFRLSFRAAVLMSV